MTVTDTRFGPSPAGLEPLAPGEPTHLGGYRLLGRLGQGGFGAVYLGERDQQHAAIKIIRPDRAADPTFRTRFDREVRALGAVRSRYVAELLDADAESNPAWLAMEFAEGPSLAAWIRHHHHGLPEEDWWLLATGLLHGLAAIHDRGIVHRDIKPDNVMLTPDGPRLVDFGISALPALNGFTATGTLLGSQGYVAPERLRGGDPDPKNDVFAAAATLTYAAVGRHPFQGKNEYAVLQAVLTEPPDLTGVPGPLISVLTPLFDKDPGRRPSAIQALALLQAEHATTSTNTWATLTISPAAAPVLTREELRTQALTPTRSLDDETVRLPEQQDGETDEPEGSTTRTDADTTLIQPAAETNEPTAADDDPDAMVRLGRLRESDGDLAAARDWYRRAAALGDPGAMHSLGALEEDDGDRIAALRWYREAAAHGHRDSANDLTVQRFLTAVWWALVVLGSLGLFALFGLVVK